MFDDRAASFDSEFLAAQSGLHRLACNSRRAHARISATFSSLSFISANSTSRKRASQHIFLTASLYLCSRRITALNHRTERSPSSPGRACGCCYFADCRPCIGDYLTSIVRVLLTWCPSTSKAFTTMKCRPGATVNSWLTSLAVRSWNSSRPSMYTWTAEMGRGE